jgi:hypothetical protein
MPAVLTCPGCKANLRIEPDQKSPMVRCPKCLAVVAVPGNNRLPAGKVTTTAPTVATVPKQTRPAPASKVVVLLLVVVLALAGAISLASIVLPIAGLGDGLLSYAVAGLAILTGLVALALSVLARGTLFGAAVSCVFLGASGLFFAVGHANNSRDEKAAADAMAKARAKEDEVKRDQDKADEARKAAADMLKKAEEAPAEAKAILKKAEEAEARAAEAPQKAAEILEEVKEEQAKLDKQREKLKNQTIALGVEQAKADQAKAKLEELRLQAEAAEKAAADQKKQAQAEQQKATEWLEKAAQKEKEAQALYKKITDAIEGVKGKLKAKLPEDRVEAIQAIARIGLPAVSADVLLCEVAAFDPAPAPRKEALQALEVLRPDLAPMIVTLSLPPDGPQYGSHQIASRKLAKMGPDARAAIPVLVAKVGEMHDKAAQLLKVKNNLGYEYDLMLFHLETLVKVGPDAPVVVKVLEQVATSTLGVSIAKSRDSKVNEPMLVCVKHLGEMGFSCRDLRKQVMPVLVLALKDSAESIQIAAAAQLARFGTDAADAAPLLRDLRLHPSEAVRNAARDALAKIMPDK